MKIRPLFLGISLGGLSFGALTAGGCGTSGGGSSPIDGGSPSSSGSSAQGGAPDSAASSSATPPAGDAGASDAGDASTLDAASVLDAEAELPCLAVTCALPNEVCCPGFDVDGGAECPDASACVAQGGDVYECTGQINCPNDGDVCCVNYGAAQGGGDLAICENGAACAAGFGSDGGTDQVCQGQSDCASLGETCAFVAGGASLMICN